MTEHEGLPVSGYVAQSDDKIALVNDAKALEEQCLRHLDKLRIAGADYFDQRMVSIAFTGIQEAFMWANRAVFQPTRIVLPGDTEDAGK